MLRQVNHRLQWFNRRSGNGATGRLFTALQEERIIGEGIRVPAMDSTGVKVHRHAAGAPKKGAPGPSASPGEGGTPKSAWYPTAGARSSRSMCISSSRCFVFSHVFFSGLGSCMHFPYFSGCAEVFLPNMRASLTRRLWPVNSRSRPWCTMRSMIAAASLSSAKTVPHLLNSVF